MQVASNPILTKGINWLYHAQDLTMIKIQKNYNCTTSTGEMIPSMNLSLLPAKMVYKVHTVVSALMKLYKIDTVNVQKECL